MVIDRVSDHTYVPRGWWDLYKFLYGLLSEYGRREVDSLKSTAVGYVWGWQDRAGDGKDTQVSIDFGYAYGVHAAEMELGRTWSRMPVQDAWESWRKLGRIDRDWYMIAV